VRYKAIMGVSRLVITEEKRPSSKLKNSKSDQIQLIVLNGAPVI
jgi:hypothetical protein